MFFILFTERSETFKSNILIQNDQMERSRKQNDLNVEKMFRERS